MLCKLDEPVLKLEPVTTPTAFISLSVIVKDPVPTVNIPVTLAFPVTTKSSLNVVAPPTFAVFIVISSASVNATFPVLP